VVQGKTRLLLRVSGLRQASGLRKRPAWPFDWPARTTCHDGTTETVFAVKWPFLRMEYRPLWSGRDTDLDDAAVIRADARSQVGYIFLPDGRIDLLTREEHPSWDFG